jgi:hypothetical protein
MKISLAQHRSHREARYKTIEICTFKVVFRGILPDSHPYPLFYPYTFIQFNRSRQDVSFYTQTSLARHHSHRGFRCKMIKICTFNVVFHSISPNSHPYPLFYPYIFTPFNRSRQDLSFYTKISLARRHSHMGVRRQTIEICTFKVVFRSI